MFEECSEDVLRFWKENGLTIRPSRIVGAGLGLFAAQKIVQHKEVRIPKRFYLEIDPAHVALSLVDLSDDIFIQENQ